MTTVLTSLTILAFIAALGGCALAAPDAGTDARALNARWAALAFSALLPGSDVHRGPAQP